MRNKKLWVAAVALIASLAVVGVLYAQDEGTVGAGKGAVKIDGSVKTGVRMDVTSQKMEGDAKGKTSNVPVIYGYSDDIDDGTALRASLQATYENARVGFKVGLRGQAGHGGGPLMITSANQTSAGVYNAYGWLKLFSDKFVISGGLIDDDIWGTGALGDTETDTNFDAVNGFRLALQPIEGLSFGVAFDITPTTTAAGPVGEDIYVNHIGQTTGALFGNMRIGGLYNSEAFGAALTVKLNGKEPTAGGAFKGMDILFGFKLKSIPNTLVILDGRINNVLVAETIDLTPDPVQEEMGNGNAHISLKGQYTLIEKLHVGARYIMDIYMAHNGDKKSPQLYNGIAGVKDNAYFLNNLDHQIKLFGNYDFTQVVNAGVELTVDIDGKTDAQVDRFKNTEKNGAIKSFTIRPVASFNITEGLAIKIWDDVIINMGSYVENLYHDGNEAAGYIDNRLQIDFVWSF